MRQRRPHHQPPHPSHRHSIGSLIVLAVVTLACNLTTTTPSTPASGNATAPDQPAGDRPIVVVVAPASGSQGYIGGRIEIRVRAQDSVGITRIVVVESGQVKINQPTPDPVKDFEALLPYIPSVTGTITLTVTAYRGTLASEPATLSLTIVNRLQDLDNPNAFDATKGVAVGAFCTVTVNNNVLNLRAGPGTTFNVLAKLSLGELLNVIGRSSDSKWYQIKRATGSLGWVSADYVIANGDCSAATVISG